jgi:FKBP-type peptidyl-prolyl cis-trans isomerase SlyD
MIVEKNKVVSINYTLTSTAGEVLDSSEVGTPLDYLHGSGNLIPGLEKALEGKKTGDRLTVTVPPEEGYGLYDDGLILNIKKDRFDTEDDVKTGMEFSGQTEDGEFHIFRVISIKGDKVKVDGNHALAGQTLNFEVSVAGIREATEEELTHGHVHGDDGCGDCGQNCGEDCGEDCCGH